MLEPLLGLVLVDDADGSVAGYCLATSDTASFLARYETDIRPGLLAQVPTTARAHPTAREASIHAMYAQAHEALPAGILEVNAWCFDSLFASSQ
jgi:hypothetical protein